MLKTVARTVIGCDENEVLHQLCAGPQWVADYVFKAWQQRDINQNQSAIVPAEPVQGLVAEPGNLGLPQISETGRQEGIYYDWQQTGINISIDMPNNPVLVIDHLRPQGLIAGNMEQYGENMDSEVIYMATSDADED